LRALGSDIAHFCLASVTCLAALALPAVAETQPAVGLTLDGMSYVLSRGSEVDLVIDAKRARVSLQAGRIALAGVRARVGPRVGAPQSAGAFEFACDRGELDLATREFVASGHIGGRLQDGRTLRADRLRYRHELGVVSSDAPVSLEDEAGDYRGGGFQYWVREDRFRLTGGARIRQGER
jgi:hypothetical protein